MNGLVVFAALLTTIVTLTVTFTVIFPVAARARFTRDVSALRDEVQDKVFTGDLPDAPGVRAYVDRCDGMLRDAGAISYSLLLALHLTIDALGVKGPRRPQPSYALLTPVQRRTMHEFDEALLDSLARYIVDGSRYAVPMRVVQVCAAPIQWLKKGSPAPTPDALATEFNSMVADRRGPLHGLVEGRAPLSRQLAS